MVPKKELSAGKTTFSQVEIRYESARVPFDQLEVSGKNEQSQKNPKWKNLWFQIILYQL